MKWFWALLLFCFSYLIVYIIVDKSGAIIHSGDSALLWLCILPVYIQVLVFSIVAAGFRFYRPLFPLLALSTIGCMLAIFVVPILFGEYMMCKDC